MANVNKYMFPGMIKEQSVPIVIVGNYPCFVSYTLKAKFTILYFHGNGETVSDFVENQKQLIESEEFNLVCPEYAGYGSRGGVETDRGCETMSEAIFMYCKLFKLPIIVIGFSIGSGPACHLAKEHSPDGIVLINPFFSIKHLALDIFGVFGALIKNRFPNHKRLQKYNGKLLVISGEKDDLIPMTHSIRLHQYCQSNDKRILINPEMGHGPTDWRQQVYEPLKSCFISLF
jgi:pimeloyl-ACP methyl ester carboxylesterase